MSQFPNVTKRESRDEVEFAIAAGERESNSIHCENKSLLAALILQNIESDSIEVLGSVDDELYYPLSWNDEELGFSVLQKPWEMKHAYFPAAKDVSDEISSALDVAFKPDGSMMFVLDGNADSVKAYDLFVNWDITTAKYQKSFDISSQPGSPAGFAFKPDGGMMFIIGDQEGTFIHAYRLKDVWDITTASEVGTLDVASSLINTSDIAFRPDGTQMFVLGGEDPGVYAYDLSSVWDIETAVLEKNTGFLGPFSEGGLAFKKDGTKMFSVSVEGDVYSYSLGTAWDISNVIQQSTFDVSSQESNPVGIAFKPDGKEMFIVGSASNSVFRYNYSAAWDLSTAYLQNNFDSSDKEAEPADVYFDTTGTKMFVFGVNSWSVHAYELEEPWQLHNASFVASLNLLYTGFTPASIFFKPDGSKLFVIGDSANPGIDVWDLSTAWDLSSATLDESFENYNGRGFSFNSKGTLMFISGISGNIMTYSLSSAWDVSTATEIETITISEAQGNILGSPVIKKDDSLIVVPNYNTSVIHEYEFIIPSDIETANPYQSINFSYLDQNIRGLTIEREGKLMVLAGEDNGGIYAIEFKRNSWVSIGEPSLTKPYEYLKMRTSETESGDRTIKGIIGV